jgi:putative transcriptional regulator
VQHDDEGALGVVLNRRAETTVGEAVPALAELVDEDEPIHLGGPVQPSSVVLLGRFADPQEAAALAFEDVGLLGADPDDAQPDLLAARAFVGYAGWGPGQLDDERERGDWFTTEARLADVFADEPEALWPSVLERMGGSYALVARMPPDPALN